jgi:hypothetical protein
MVATNGQPTEGPKASRPYEEDSHYAQGQTLGRRAEGGRPETVKHARHAPQQADDAPRQKQAQKRHQGQKVAIPHLKANCDVQNKVAHHVQRQQEV